MQRHRFSVAAELFFDVEAVTPEVARNRAAEAIERAGAEIAVQTLAHGSVRPIHNAALILEETDEVLR